MKEVPSIQRSTKSVITTKLVISVETLEETVRRLYPQLCKTLPENTTFRFTVGDESDYDRTPVEIYGERPILVTITYETASVTEEVHHEDPSTAKQ